MATNDNGNGAGYTVKEILVRLEVKVDKALDDHEARIRSLESDGNKRKGAGTFLMSAVAFIAATASVVAVFVH